MKDLPEIRTLVPHAGPMLLLDRIVSVDAESVCAEVRIRKDSLFCVDGGVGAWVGLEYIAQAIAVYAGFRAALRGEAVKVGFLLGTQTLRMRSPNVSRWAAWSGFVPNESCKRATAWLRSTAPSTTKAVDSAAPALQFFSPPMLKSLFDGNSA